MNALVDNLDVWDPETPCDDGHYWIVDKDDNVQIVKLIWHDDLGQFLVQKMGHAETYTLDHLGDVAWIKILTPEPPKE